MSGDAIFIFWIFGIIVTAIVRTSNDKNENLTDVGIILAMMFWPLILANEVRKWF